MRRLLGCFSPFTRKKQQSERRPYVGIVAFEEPWLNVGRRFEYRELEEATNDFREANRLGAGASGVVYRGIIDNTQVAIKKLTIDETQFEESERQFDAEVLTIRRANHPNIVGFIGFCAEGNQRLVVYEYMARGSLDNLLNEKRTRATLDWHTRMKIVVGAARGLAYLHSQMNPPVIFRDMKSANILLGEGYNPKLSDFGSAIHGPVGDQTYITTGEVMGTGGYIAPEYQQTKQLTYKADIYSFGVVLLEIISGCLAIYQLNNRPNEFQYLTKWAKPLLEDARNYTKMADTKLHDQYPASMLTHVLLTARRCLQEQADNRPTAVELAEDLKICLPPGYDLGSSSSHQRADPRSSPSHRRSRSS